jgi:hypothetical protein
MKRTLVCGLTVGGRSSWLSAIKGKYTVDPVEGGRQLRRSGTSPLEEPMTKPEYRTR